VINLCGLVMEFVRQHLQIMARTRGLGHAIGRVIGISLGREDHHDSDDVPQR